MRGLFLSQCSLCRCTDRFEWANDDEDIVIPACGRVAIISDLYNRTATSTVLVHTPLPASAIRILGFRSITVDCRSLDKTSDHDAALTVKNEHTNELGEQNATAEAARNPVSREESTECKKTEKENFTSKATESRRLRYDSKAKASKDSTSVNKQFTMPGSCDRVPEDFRYSVTEAKKVTGQNLGRASNDTNEKGAPQKYRLHPLNAGVLRKHLSTSEGLVAAADDRFRADRIQQGVNWRIDQLADLQQQKERMSTQVLEMENYKHCLTSKDLTVARSSLCEFIDKEKRLRNKLSNVVSQEVPGTHGRAAVAAVSKQFDFETLSARVDHIYNRARPKLQFAKLCDDNGVKYTDATDDIAIKRFALEDRDFYICFANNMWIQLQRKFIRLVNDKKKEHSARNQTDEPVFYYTFCVDAKKAGIEHYVDGHLVKGYIPLKVRLYAFCVLMLLAISVCMIIVGVSATQ